MLPAIGVTLTEQASVARRFRPRAELFATQDRSGDVGNIQLRERLRKIALLARHTLVVCHNGERLAAERERPFALLDVLSFRLSS